MQTLHGTANVHLNAARRAASEAEDGAGSDKEEAEAIEDAILEGDTDAIDEAVEESKVAHFELQRFMPGVISCLSSALTLI